MNFRSLKGASGFEGCRTIESALGHPALTALSKYEVYLSNIFEIVRHVERMLSSVSR